MKRRILTMAVAVLAMKAVTLPAQTFTVLHSFTNTPDGAYPEARLVLSGDTLYGTTVNGGLRGYGAVFSINTNGTGFTVLHSFTNTPDGSHPAANLVLSDGTLYGTTGNGGSQGSGTVFSISTNGTGFTVLHSFTNNPDGANPLAGLVLSGDTLYGTTQVGGNWDSGTVFSIGTNGTGYLVLYSFTGSSDDGAQPMARLVSSGDTLYGTTQLGGEQGVGTVFSINTDGTGFTVLHSLTSDPDGSFPQAGLVLSDNTLYGTTILDGSQGSGTVFSLKTNGTDFTVLYNFTGGTDGASPYAGLLLSGNTLYGTAVNGGSVGEGTVFSVNTDGTGFTVLYDFTGGADGGWPYAGLVLADNTLYGTAFQSGSKDLGTVFSVQVPPPPPVTISNLTCNLDGSVTIYFVGGANSTIRVEAATDLTPTVVWQTVGTNVVGPEGLWQFTDTNASLYPVRYYRSATP
jgi:uncharacterized repeat protein (TIGR03803 family)